MHVQKRSFEHFMYRNSIMEKRCIIPVSGFFETNDQNGNKYPFHIKTKNGNPLAFAGLYTVIDTFITFTILTKDASPLFTKIHNKKKRQPVILDKDRTHNWLSIDLKESDIKDILRFDCPENNLDAYSVSKDLFSSKIDSDGSSILNKVK